MALLEVSKLAKLHRRRLVVDDVNLEVNAGEIVGLLGPNGAGKTTCFKMITGQVTPNGGKVVFNGQDVTPLSMFARFRLGLACVPQAAGIFRKILNVFRRASVEQSILAVLKTVRSSRISNSALTGEGRRDRTKKLLEQFGLTHLRGIKVAKLSAGEKLRLHLAQCLAGAPLLLLLDEPFLGVDPVTVAAIRQILIQIRQAGISVLLTGCNVREDLKITTRAYLINGGKIRSQGTPYQLVNDPIAISEYLGAGFNDDSFARADKKIFEARVVPEAGERDFTLIPTEHPGLPPDVGGPPKPVGAMPIVPIPHLTGVQPPRAPASSSSTTGVDIWANEKPERFVELLKAPTTDLATAALISKGNSAVPALLTALERRDVELRRLVVHILQEILKRPIPFDPFASEIVRMRQLASLRDNCEPQANRLHEVQFTVYRPKTVRPNVWYPLLAFTHLAERRRTAPADEPDPIEQVREQAQQILGDRAREFRDSSVDVRQAIPRAGQITLLPDVPGIEFNPRQRTFSWLEDVQREEFRFCASAALDGQPARGRLSAYLGVILIAEVDLTIKVDSAYSHEQQSADAVSARPYRKIFASYSHKDAEIVRQLEQHVETLGDKYLRDVRDLRAGEHWDEALLRLIEEAEVFQLFWSTSSMVSPFVRREWEHALSLSRPYFIRPIYWEDPLPEMPTENLPPEVLRRLHFHRIALAAIHFPPARHCLGETQEFQVPSPPSRGARHTLWYWAVAAAVLAAALYAGIMFLAWR